MEREKRFELSTSSLARRHSTTELLPHNGLEPSENQRRKKLYTTERSCVHLQANPNGMLRLRLHDADEQTNAFQHLIAREPHGTHC
jgi:hypothetical protein